MRYMFLFVAMLIGCSTTEGRSLPTKPPVITTSQRVGNGGVEVIWPVSELPANGDHASTILIIRIQKYGALMPLTGITIRMLPEETHVPFMDISISNDKGELVSDVVHATTGNRVQIDLKKYAPEPSVEYLYVRARIPRATPPGEYRADLTINNRDTETELEYTWQWVIVE